MHVVMDLYGRYVLSYNISATETAASAIESFKRTFKVELGAQPRIRIHTDRGVAYCSMAFNDYLAKRARSKTLAELE